MIKETYRRRRDENYRKKKKEIKGTEK